MEVISGESEFIISGMQEHVMADAGISEDVTERPEEASEDARALGRQCAIREKVCEFCRG